MREQPHIVPKVLWVLNDWPFVAEASACSACIPGTYSGSAGTCSGRLPCARTPPRLYCDLECACTCTCTVERGDVLLERSIVMMRAGKAVRRGKDGLTWVRRNMTERDRGKGGRGMRGVKEKEMGDVDRQADIQGKK